MLICFYTLSKERGLTQMPPRREYGTYVGHMSYCAQDGYLHEADEANGGADVCDAMAPR